MSIEQQEKPEPNVPAAPPATEEPPFSQGHEVHPTNHEPFDDPVPAK
ncbi:hypothetical protein [Amycolatopsis jiangsuensis]|uniref:Uncharacterized protein n=1 Tax=Amycolatopsis jiangsuensis TaxID=1181879 RepID=A0A840IZN6_9PSEU|nr:hypothetical protein [Amycolatopsis jiangsuensis]MBB4686875.1 hypothetical protein [Amycolatopsis jiangsuensis]